MQLGVHGVYLDSSIIDEGALVKPGPLQCWGVIRFNWNPLHHLWYLVSLTIWSYVVL